MRSIDAYSKTNGNDFALTVLGKASQEQTPEKAIEQLTGTLLFEYKKRFGTLQPPIDPVRIAELVGAKVEEAPASIASEGQLLPIRHGFIIRHRGGLPPSRINLTICHEIAHTFFYDCSQSIPKRLFGRQPTREEEGLCFVAARQLLVPREALDKYLHDALDLPLLHLLRELSHRFHASLPVMAIRLTKDTSLINNVMFTFWVPCDASRTSNKQSTQGREHNHHMSSLGTWKKHSYLSPAGEEAFSVYRRTLIYEKALPLVQRVANNMPGRRTELLEIGKKKRFRVSLEGRNWGPGRAVTATHT